MFKSSQKGVSLFLTIMILSVILSVVLGLTTILISQIRTVREMGNSTIAFYAANTGIEKVLDIAQEFITAPVGTPNPATPEFYYPKESLGNNAEYEVSVVCCEPDEPPCLWTLPNDPCPSGTGLEIDDLKCTNAWYFCITSTGIYGSSKRAIRVDY